MPAGVIVVKQSQRRLFAGPRALPSWLRSFWLARSRLSERELDADSSSASLRARGGDSRPRVPRLDLEASGAHRCNGCGICVRVCPSRCLRVETEGKGALLAVTAFEIARSSCIGCGICLEVCPENAIEMSLGLEVELATGAGRPLVADLLMAGD